MSAKPVAIIFGAGKGGERAYRALRRRYRIAGFSDNNAQRHGQRLLGLPIIAPAELKASGAGRVVIASQYAAQIYPQLHHDLGWSADQIEIVADHVLTGRREIPWLGLTALGIVAVFLLAILAKLLLL